MEKITDLELLIKLKKKDEHGYAQLYGNYYAQIKRFIIKNNGSEEDAEDNFQETVIVLFKQLNNAEFKLTSSLKTYLFAISRNLWLKKLRDQKTTLKDDANLPAELFHGEEETFFEVGAEPSKEERLNTWLLKITNYCKSIVQAIFFQKESMDSLMVKMGWKNRHTADNQKYKCLQQIKKQAAKELL